MGNSTNHKKTTTTYQIERVTPQKLPWYGKRLIQEHLTRYQFATPFVQDKIVVDIACGTGYGSKLLANAGAKQVIGIDNDQQAIGIAEKKYQAKNLSYVIGDAEKLSLKTSSIDMIVSFETIEHFVYPQRFLHEIKRILKPDGMLILSTPNQALSYRDNPFHVKEYTYHEFQLMFSSFTQKHFYGQRPVYKPIVLLYKKLMTKTTNHLLRTFLRLRPWEPVNIHEIHKEKNTDYLYFICVGRNKK